MGRFFGRRPDRTAAIARGVKDILAPGEVVVAGVDVQTPGTLGAAMQGGASGAVAGAVGVPMTFSDAGDAEHSGWAGEAVAMGVAPDAVHNLVFASLVLTTSRLILLRRSKATRQIKEPVYEWPVSEIDRIEVPKAAQRLTIHRGDRSLTFELAQAHKFRPAVYGELNDQLGRVKAGL